MTKPTSYIQNFEILKEGREREGNLRYYVGLASTQSLNSQSFRMSPEAIAEIVKQLNLGNGKPMYPLHRTYGTFPIGRTVSARQQDGKARTQFYIQAGLETAGTDELISLLDAGTVDSLSLGLFGDYKCDKCGELMHASLEGWFSIVRKCDNGHRLGYPDKKTGKTLTATMIPPIRVLELSVVGAGADPDAKIIKKLQEQLQEGEFDEETLLALAEINNVSFGNLCEQLSFEPKQRSTSVPNPNDKTDELLELENEKLVEQKTALETEKTQLETELETAKARITELETEVSDAQETLDTTKEDLSEQSKVAKEGTAAIEELRKQYRRWYIASYLNEKPSDDELETLDEGLKEKTVAELVRGIKRLRNESLEQRSGGRKSVDDEDQTGNPNKKNRNRAGMKLANDLR